MMSKERYDYWRRRGFDDARRGKAALFRERQGRVFAKGEWPESNDSDEEEAGRAYLTGYDAGSEV